MVHLYMVTSFPIRGKENVYHNVTFSAPNFAVEQVDCVWPLG